MGIPVNAGVVCADGPCGRSTYIIINPTTYEEGKYAIQWKKGTRGKSKR